ncbi:hypothetical protein EG68_00989 [Paragonimus skrjabini miyazakii]|uniref:Ephexin-1 n=1 Tax=Paragonimus skrjabini miyazakii TaxID=59628 RepID=A0A8S9ZBX7_9TREM|nr:hypothetical protein EG68_00989 [Paragonimus skrjabini miyazakii]
MSAAATIRSRVNQTPNTPHSLSAVNDSSLHLRRKARQNNYSAQRRRYTSDASSFACCACCCGTGSKKWNISSPTAPISPPASPSSHLKPNTADDARRPSVHSPLDSTTEQWSPKDIGDVVLKLRDNENKFEKRQKYQSMFKDAPLYQVYSEGVNRRNHGINQPIARVSSGDGINSTNSLEFNDGMFLAIDSDEQEFNASDKSGSPELVEHALEEWKRRTAERHSDRSNKSSGSKGRSPPPVVHDSRARVNSPKSPTAVNGTTSLDRKSAKQPSGHQTEMHSFVNEIAGSGPNRALWSQMPQVIAAGLANGLTKVQKKLQEALFEIITSEASYFRSLNVLIGVFYKAPCMQADSPGAVITHTEKHHLFSNILEIHMTSENFLRAMEACFREDPWLVKLCEIIYEHAETKFETYVTYVQNQIYQTRTLCKLLTVPTFAEALRRVQSQPDCAFLDLNSFLLLPMQRVTRLRLLTTTVLHYAPRNTPVYQSGLVALAALEKFICMCDAKKMYMEQKERMMQLTIQFEYKLDAKSVATESRRLIKEGELRLVTVYRHAGSAFQRKLSGIMRQKIVNASLFLFNDLLVIAKKRSNNRIMVDDSCQLTDVQVEVCGTPANVRILRYYPEMTTDGQEHPPPSPRERVLARKTSAPSSPTEINGFEVYPFRIIIQSDAHPRAEYKLQAKSLSERERWVDAISPIQYGVTEERLIRDCPQVLITRSYSAVEGDELELKEGDAVTLLVSLSDGWCKGMLPGGRKGWFPDNVCVEVEDPNMKRENMKNFLLMEAARTAYARRKLKEQFTEFPKMKDLKRK